MTADYAMDLWNPYGRIVSTGEDTIGHETLGMERDEAQDSNGHLRVVGPVWASRRTSVSNDLARSTLPGKCLSASVAGV